MTYESTSITESVISTITETPTEAIANSTEAIAISTEAMIASSGALFTANNIWMMLATALVFIMHLGFASIEAGFGQSKNTVNILFKNTLTPLIGLITFFICGFNLMYPGGFGIINGVLGFSGFGLSIGEGASINYASGGYTYWTDFLFQGMFAATAATIVSGAIAERVKISAYLIFTIIFVGLVYPILGSWKWGGGFLDSAGFYDFAGSTLVHSVGGWGALAGIIVIGPRLGKFVKGKVIDKPSTSVPLAVIGVFLLWLGWFGFNGGSVLSADPDLVSYVLVTTCMAASTGGIFAFFTASFIFKRLDLAMVLNGILAGLVAITAGADVIPINMSLVVGAIAGVLVVLSTITLNKLKLDDMVGAVPVHLVCGIWGTLAVGIFSINPNHTILIQLYGIAMYALGAFPIAFGIFYLLKKTIGVRVSEKHEIEGLDIHEHGIRGYTLVYDN